MKFVIICAALLAAICSAGAEPVAKVNGFAPVPRPQILGLLTYTSEWPVPPVVLYDKWQWVYSGHAPNWRHIPKSRWR
jgi:hypothetical protein